MTAHDVSEPVATTVVAWLGMLSVDLFLHAGLLAPLNDWGSPFLLEPEAAFLRIPIGYLGKLMLAGLVVWLLPQLGINRGPGGAIVAGGVGATVMGALCLVFQPANG